MRPTIHFSLTALTALVMSISEGAIAAGPARAIATTTNMPPTPTLVSPPSPLPTWARSPEAGPLPLWVAQTEQPASEVERLYQQGLMYFNRSQFREAIAAWEQVLDLARQMGFRRGEGGVLNALGEAYQNLSQYERAIGLYEEALAIARELDNRNGESAVLGNLGGAYWSQGNYPQAIEFFQQSLAVAREIGDRQAVGNALGNLSNAYDSLGEYERAIEFSQQALAIFRELGNRTQEGNALGNLGVIYLNLAEYPRAIEVLQQALTIAREVGNRAGEGRILNVLGETYRHLGQYEQAIAFNEQALAIFRQLGARAEEGLILSSLGGAHIRLGQYERAIAFYEQALAIAQAIGDQHGEATALGNLGEAYRSSGAYEQAIDLYEQALMLFRQLGARAGEGTIVGNLGIVYWNLGQYEKSIGFVEQQLAIARELGSRTEEGRALGNLGFAYKDLGDYEQALEQYRQAVALLNELGARPAESYFLSAIGQLLVLQDQPELAIVFLKASVEIREAIRGDIRGLETDLQQSFTDTVADDYRLLADLLLQQNRIVEAQRVLDLLKVQELDDYLEDVQRNAQTETGVDFWQPEQEVLALYDDVLVAGAELERLQAQNPHELSPEEQARKAELEAQQNVVYTSFIDWLDHPEILAAIDQLRVDTRSRTVDIENFTDLQAQLAQLPQQSVILYPLVLPDRLELVLVSAAAPPVRYPVAVEAEALNQAVVELGQALKDRGSDPRPVAQQLYDWVIAPLEADLAAVGAENIIFAPDGVLRYVPLATLYDGEQWLAERFSFSQITAASETDFATRPRDEPALLAAACEACSFTVTVGDDAFNFLDLPATRQEVELLADQVPEAEVLINREFTPDQFKRLLGSYTLIHLATHGQFVAGNPDESFVLFGNGQSVNLRQMRREWSQLDADLVVLSACETALGSPELGNGIEVLGLGFQLQRVGAKAVVASLWQVSDQGTQVLMTAFYTALSQGMTKAAALQAAQQALITGEAIAAETVLRAGASPLSREDTSGVAALPGYSHPYYWAPFILIGNGL